MLCKQRKKIAIKAKKCWLADDPQSGIYILPNPAISFIQGIFLYIFLGLGVFVYLGSYIFFKVVLYLDCFSSCTYDALNDYFINQLAYGVYLLAVALLSGTFYTGKIPYQIKSDSFFYKLKLFKRLNFSLYIVLLAFAPPILIAVLINQSCSLDGIVASDNVFNNLVGTPWAGITIIGMAYTFAIMSIYGKGDPIFGILRVMAFSTRYHIWKIR